MNENVVYIGIHVDDNPAERARPLLWDL